MRLQKADDLFQRANSLPEIFDVVKELVRRHLKVERSGLMVGLSDLGAGNGVLVGGFFQVAGNMIVMNRFPLARIQAQDPALVKPFALHILLHEYIHSIGYLDEISTRHLVHRISSKQFGPKHIVTQMADGWGRYFADLEFPEVGWQPEGDFSIEVVRGLDARATDYIQ